MEGRNYGELQRLSLSHRLQPAYRTQ